MRAKTILILIVIAILIVCALAFFFLKSSPQQTPAQDTTNPFAGIVSHEGPTAQPGQISASPTDTVHDFYAWYVQGFAQSLTFSSSPEFQAGAGKWLTSSFAATLSNTVAENDGDPILLAQDYQPTWLTDITPVLVNQSDTTSTVTLTLGTGTQAKTYAIVLVKGTDSVWRISSISSGA